MKIVVADTGAIISLVHIRRLDLIEIVFGDFCIAKAVWVELSNYDNPNFDRSQLKGLKGRVKEIKSKNYLSMVMDFGESESVVLYEELKADYLLIDDKKARLIAESLNINCIGTLGLLLKAKNDGILPELRPLFDRLISDGRFYSRKLLNDILIKIGE